MKIGSIQLENNLVFAPLAGITNLPMRLLAKEAGCGLVCSEMISANGLVHGSEKTRLIMASVDSEKPLSVQIFGSDPDTTAEAARMVEGGGADLVDINFGCSVKKIVKTGSGVALMRTPELARRLMTAVRKAVSIPLTIKLRSGWDNSGRQAIGIAKLAQDCGVDGIAIHPRTAGQGFSGCADWSLIQKVKASVSLPVIGNGDITAPGDALGMLKATGCDGIMVGRAAIGNPILLSRILGALDGRDPGPPAAAARLELMGRYAETSVRYFGEEMACLMMRSRLMWFVRGLPFAKRFRESIKRVSCLEDIREQIDRYGQALAAIESQGLQPGPRRSIRVTH
ncbi:MAG: tRNA dihydrouridine synthase DusB [Desulfobacterales bacterium]|jgi:nifR3 family TIM-barrel protein